MTRRWPFRSLVVVLGVSSLFFGVEEGKEPRRTLTKAAGPPSAPMPKRGAPPAGEVDNEIDQVKAQLAAAREAMEEAKKTQEILSKELDEEKAKVKTAAEKLAESEKALAEAKKALAKSQADLKVAETKLAKALKDQEALRKELETAKAQEKSITAKFDLAKKECDKAKVDATKTTKELVEAQKNLAKSQADHIEALKTLVNAKTAQENLQMKLAAETTKFNDALARLEQMTQKVKRTQAKLERKRKAALQPAAAALIEVTLPDDALLTFDGKPTASTGDVRLFESPALSQGWTYHYTLTSEVMRDGKPVKTETKIQVEAGKKTVVNLNLSAVSETSTRP